MTDFQSNKKCKYFDDCSAPMCPQDLRAAKTAWFANEPVCRLHDVPECVKRQRKIAKTGVTETAGCFTLPMLERDCMIKKGITGIDPDSTDLERKATEKVWLEKHPRKKPVPKEMQVKYKAQAEYARAMRSRKCVC
jgi:hypothetical protein